MLAAVHQPMFTGGNDDLRAVALRAAAEEEKAKWKKYGRREAGGRLEHGSHRGLIRRSRNSYKSRRGRNFERLSHAGRISTRKCDAQGGSFHHFTDISLLGVGRQSRVAVIMNDGGTQTKYGDSELHSD